MELIFKASFILLVVAGTPSVAVIDSPDTRYLIAYTSDNCEGPFHTFLDSSSDLRDESMDKIINSVYGAGMWFFYSTYNYQDKVGQYQGFNYCYNLAGKEISSLRYTGSPYGMHDVYYNLYEDVEYGGDEYGSYTDTKNVYGLSGHVSSVVINGQSPWTFFTGTGYTGQAVCVYPNTHFSNRTPNITVYLDTLWAGDMS